ncbi:GNAT family N-acetyltransferase [Mucilaginibacter ginkgonis]|uniref:GNAT family N-acetyltransferase n=1 Tax=Mucilaginibacter ginkgonis TaxID=2682091 RepID=A0A6I4I7J3_9SPHI|nr:GNAT family N-acetyltransferase [Mucilaginibacter ginkgonis]QQL49159.1 GNAT family N-acetyltransferase [Mucilaginibacter ginkgonis]
MTKILFVCIENSNRSQMAQAFAKILGNGKVEAFSAGSNPSGKINPKAISAMKEFGYDLTTHSSKNLDDVSSEAPFDYVVTMGCGDACPWMPAKHFIDWQIPDPRDMNAEEFNMVRDQIKVLVSELISQLITIRLLNRNDWPSVKEIYLKGMATDNATFQTEAPSWEDWDSSHLNFGRLAAEIDGTVVAWAALSPVSSRCVYAGVAEVSVYVDPAFAAIGIGSAILSQLITASESNGIWTLQSGIFPENTGSIRIHEKNGFRFVGRREKIGKMNGIWRDTLLFERRSKAI